MYTTRIDLHQHTEQNSRSRHESDRPTEKGKKEGVLHLMRKLLRPSFVVLFLVIATIAFAQSKSISGTIVDSLGESIIGANVMVKGTTNGTITDIDGTKDAGVVWCSPWRVEITPYLVDGENNIEIHVANSLMNRMIYDASLKEEERVTYSYPQIATPGDKLELSGLRQVKLIREECRAETTSIADSETSSLGCCNEHTV